MSEKCGNCKFYRGEHCVRNPPITTLVKEATYIYPRETATIWAKTNENMWCGEWKEVENE